MVRRSRRQPAAPRKGDHRRDTELQKEKKLACLAGRGSEHIPAEEIADAAAEREKDHG